MPTPLSIRIKADDDPTTTEQPTNVHNVLYRASRSRVNSEIALMTLCLSMIR